MSKQILTATKTNLGETKVMKIRNLALALTVSALVLPLQAADVGVGTSYLSLPISVTAAQPLFVGASLARPPVMKGWLAADVAASATSFTTANAASSSNMFNGLTVETGAEDGSGATPLTDNHYVVEITSGASTGLIKIVTAFGTNQITVNGGLPALTVGTTFVLRKDHTLASLFGNADSANLLTQSGLTTGSTAGSADVVSVLDSTGAWKKFFYRAGTGWRLTTARTGSDRANVRISLGTGVLLTPVTTKTISVSGEYRGTRSRVSLVNQATILANPFPVVTTLADSDLATSLTKGSTASSSDELRFLENGAFVNYFARSGTGATSPSGVAYTGFKPSLNRTGTSVDTTKSLAAGGAVLIKRAGGVHDLVFRPQYITK
jgi:hypothetical protein